MKRRKKWFAKITNIQEIEVVLERRVQEYKLLAEHMYNLLRMRMVLLELGH